MNSLQTSFKQANACNEIEQLLLFSFLPPGLNIIEFDYVIKIQ